MEQGVVEKDNLDLFAGQFQTTWITDTVNSYKSNKIIQI